MCIFRQIGLKCIIYGRKKCFPPYRAESNCGLMEPICDGIMPLLWLVHPDWRKKNSQCCGAGGSVYAFPCGGVYLYHTRQYWRAADSVPWCGVGRYCRLFIAHCVIHIIGFKLEPLTITDFFQNDTDDAFIHLTCVSTGRPVNSVTWLKDGLDLDANATNVSYSTEQYIVNPFEATYEHVLHIDCGVCTVTCHLTDHEGNTTTRSLYAAFNSQYTIILNKSTFPRSHLTFKRVMQHLTVSTPLLTAKHVIQHLTSMTIKHVIVSTPLLTVKHVMQHIS